jgi:hypothetical protein
MRFKILGVKFFLGFMIKSKKIFLFTLRGFGIDRFFPIRGKDTRFKLKPGGLSRLRVL